MPPTVILITDGSLKLADTQAGLTSAVAYQCQVTEAAINAVPNLVTIPATFCGAESQTPAATGWTLAMSWLQDWRASAGGLSGYAFTNDTLTKWFELKLDKDDVTPVASGQVRIVAGAFGAAAGVPALASVEWPLAAKPTITMPALLAADDQADDEAADDEAAQAAS